MRILLVFNLIFMLILTEIKLVDGSAKLLITDTDHVITSKVRENDEGETVLRVLSYSPTNATFKQPIGNVAEFSVTPIKT